MDISNTPTTETIALIDAGSDEERNFRTDRQSGCFHYGDKGSGQRRTAGADDGKRDDPPPDTHPGRGPPVQVDAAEFEFDDDDARGGFDFEQSFQLLARADELSIIREETASCARDDDCRSINNFDDSIHRNRNRVYLIDNVAGAIAGVGPGRPPRANGDPSATTGARRPAPR